MRVSPMIKMLLSITALTTLSAGALFAQDISGDWQGTLLALQGPLRTVLKVSKSDDGGWNALMYSIDQGPDQGGIRVTSINLQGSTLRYSIDRMNGSYEGKLSADGTSIAGTWTLNNGPRQLNFQRPTKATAWTVDSSSHSVQFITVEAGIKLEVLDWGGSGRPLVLLAGLGNTAHIFDSFADKLTATYHVYGITRRGFGASSSPIPADGNYSADRLGDDVLAVLDALKLNRPVLVGHSIAGEELSSIGTHHSKRVAGLIYLDAAYWYAFYDRSRGNLNIDLQELLRKLNQLQPGRGPSDMKPLVQELLQTSLPEFEKDLKDLRPDLQNEPQPPAPTADDRKSFLAWRAWVNRVYGIALPEAELRQQRESEPGGHVGEERAKATTRQAIIEGEEKYTDLRLPILAIVAFPHDPGPFASNNPVARAAFEAIEAAFDEPQVKAFESGVPSARVVRLPRANHYVFISNESDVLREMRTFLAALH